jgi:Ca2+-binding EF-hand superfamily protein
LPVSTEEIDYLFKRHDKEKLGRVTEAEFLKELMPLDDYISNV